MPGADRSAELAMLMQQDPEFAADLMEVQGSQAQAQATAQAGMMRAVAKRKARVLKARQAQQTGKPPPSVSEVTNQTLRGPGSEFPRAGTDFGNPMSQGRVDATGTGAVNEIDRSIAGARGGASAQEAGTPAGRVHGPGGLAAAVAQARGLPPPQPVGGGGAPPPVNIGGQQFSAPAEITTTTRREGVQGIPGRGGVLGVPFDETTTTTEPNVLTARDVAQLAVERQRAIVDTFQMLRQDTVAPASALQGAAQAAVDGDREALKQFADAYPSESVKVSRARWRLLDQERTLRFHQAEAARHEAKIAGIYSDQVEKAITRRAMGGAAFATDLSGLAGDEFQVGVEQGLMGGLDLSSPEAMMASLSGGLDVDTQLKINTQNAALEKDNAKALFWTDKKTGKVAGLNDAGEHLHEYIGWQLKANKIPLFVPDEEKAWFQQFGVTERPLVPIKSVRPVSATEFLRNIETLANPSASAEERKLALAGLEELRANGVIKINEGASSAEGQDLVLVSGVEQFEELTDPRAAVGRAINGILMSTQVYAGWELPWTEAIPAEGGDPGLRSVPVGDVTMAEWEEMDTPTRLEYLAKGTAEGLLWAPLVAATSMAGAAGLGRFAPALRGVFGRQAPALAKGVVPRPAGLAQRLTQPTSVRGPGALRGRAGRPGRAGRGQQELPFGEGPPTGGALPPRQVPTGTTPPWLSGSPAAQAQRARAAVTRTRRAASAGRAREARLEQIAERKAREAAALEKRLEGLEKGRATQKLRRGERKTSKPSKARTRRRKKKKD